MFCREDAFIFYIARHRIRMGTYFSRTISHKYRTHFYRDGKVRGQNAQRGEAKFNLFPTEARKNADASM